MASKLKISKKDLAALSLLKPGLAGVGAATAVTHLLGHGSVHAFTHEAAVAEKLSALKHRHPAALQHPDIHGGVEKLFTGLKTATAYYFGRLDPNTEYSIDSSLMSYLTLPGAGKMYSESLQPSDLSVAITFMGQFIDHDLTKNITNLIDDELGPVQDIASPYIDLDSVYGPRQPTDPLPPFAGDRFVLVKLDDSNNAYDVPRDSTGMALIPDGRNDENQLVLQVQILQLRVHNLLVKTRNLKLPEAQRETIFNWQSVVLHDYLPAVLDPAIFEQVIKDIEAELAHPGRGPVKYRPEGGMLRLPHEFAIGFRFGHSQLRNSYLVGPGRSFTLFDNLQPGPDFTDLRGGRRLTPERVIDWPFFIAPAEEQSNRIDTLVASGVFNLPESAVPDVPTNFLGNLPQRNLIRSHEIHLTSGEQLFEIFFGPNAGGKLTPEQIEPDPGRQGLFKLRPGVAFETPLWYYLLKEAELAGGLKLGKLGSRLVGEVVAGAIYYNPVAFVHEPGWKSAITQSRVVKIKDLVDFVTGRDAT